MENLNSPRDASSISAPVMNGMTIKLVLMLMLASGGIAHVVNVKGALLHGKFDTGEKIYIKIPLGFEEFYDNDTVLLLKKCLYGLKQVAMAFYRKLLAAATTFPVRGLQAFSILYIHTQNNIRFHIGIKPKTQRISQKMTLFEARCSHAPRAAPPT
jgi:hypothetical protein